MTAYQSSSQSEWWALIYQNVFKQTSPSVSLMITNRSCLTGQLSLVSSPDLGPARLHSEAGCKRGWNGFLAGFLNFSRSLQTMSL